MKAKGVLAGAVVVVVAVVVIEEMRLSDLRKQLAGIEKLAEPNVRRPVPESVAGGPTGSKPAVELSSKSARPAGSGDNSGVPAGARADRAESLRKIIENPAAKAMIDQAQRAMAGIWYDDLVKQFDLSRSESDHFYSLLAAAMTDQQEFGTKILAAKDPAARAELARQLKEKLAQHESAMREFLNDEDDFKAYQDYAARLPERQQLTGIRVAMKDYAEAMTPEQEAQLVDAMHEARVQAMPADRWGPGEAEDFLAADAEERFEAGWDAMQKVLRERVAGLLDAQQQEAFFHYQGQVKEMQLGSIRMARELFEGGGAPAGAR